MHIVMANMYVFFANMCVFFANMYVFFANMCVFSQTCMYFSQTSVYFSQICVCFRKYVYLIEYIFRIDMVLYCFLAITNENDFEEVRIPTGTWSGFGFSKSMPEATLKDLVSCQYEIYIHGTCHASCHTHAIHRTCY